MNVIFMGTPDFAVPCLARLLEDGHDVRLVVTQADKPKGRGYQLAPPPVKKFALSKNLEVFQPLVLKTDGVFDKLAACQPDLIVVVAYGKILRKRILQLPKYGCLNIHASLLPKYRGAAPIQWVVLNGETEAGVTAMKMDAGVDTGDMLLQAGIPVPEEMTSGELHDALSVLGAQVLSDTIKKLQDGSLKPEKQDESASSYAPMLDKSMCSLDFSRPAAVLHNQVRGLNPWPVAHCMIHGKIVKIFRSVVSGRTDSYPGTITHLDPLAVACGDGKSLELHEMQIEGGKRMSAADFLRGHPMKVGENIHHL